MKRLCFAKSLANPLLGLAFVALSISLIGCRKSSPDSSIDKPTDSRISDGDSAAAKGSASDSEASHDLIRVPSGLKKQALIGPLAETWPSDSIIGGKSDELVNVDVYVRQAIPSTIPETMIEDYAIP